MNASCLDPRIPPMRWTFEDAMRANDAWKFSCGPAAIAAVTGLTPDELRAYLPDFPGWMSPTHMREALRAVGARVADYRLLSQSPVKPWPSFGIARVQFGGPWMRAGVPQVAKYEHTHWVAACLLRNHDTIIFDVNALEFPGSNGWLSVETWERVVLPELLLAKRRRDGTWWPTHSISLHPVAGAPT